MKKQRKLIPYFFKMLLLGFIVLLITQIIPFFITDSLFKHKYGSSAIIEIFMALMVLIVVLRYGNSYIFTQKKERLRDTLFIGFPLLLIAFINLIANIGNIGNAPLGNTINLFILCFSIGVAEEFLCRGWIQNEFIERFGKTRKGVILSILCASIIFGVMHFTNLLSGQPLFETSLQVLQAISSGFLFGAIYFRTRNIWSSICLHGFYDFAIMLGEVSLYKDCTTMADPSSTVRIYGYITSLVIVAVYILSAVYILRREKTNQFIEKNSEEVTDNEKRKYEILKWITIGIACILLIPVDISESENYRICYHYEELKVKGIKYELHFPHYNTYTLEGLFDGLEYKVTYTINDKDELVMTDNSSGNIQVIVKNTSAFAVIANDTNYVLLVKTSKSDDSLLFLNESYENFYNLDYLNEYSSHLEEVNVPDFIDMGYITINDDEEKIAFVRNELDQIFVVKEKDKVEILVE